MKVPSKDETKPPDDSQRDVQPAAELHSEVETKGVVEPAPQIEVPTAAAPATPAVEPTHLIEVPTAAAAPATPAVEEVLQTETQSAGATAPPAVEPASEAGAQLADVATPVELQPPAAANAKPSAPARLWGRRHMITAILSLAAGSVFVLYSRWPEPKKTGNPYFRRRKRPVVASETNLAEGFYGRKMDSANTTARPSFRNIIQYVQAPGPSTRQAETGRVNRVPFVFPFSEKNRVPLPADKLPTPTDNEHVTFSRASTLFELAALQHISRGEHKAACELLLYAIRHDLLFKETTRGALSLRLWDLLAVVAVRSGKSAYLDTALNELTSEARGLLAQYNLGDAPKRKRNRNRIKAALKTRGQERQELFESRIANWSNPTWRADLREQVSHVWVTSLRDLSDKKLNKKIFSYF